MQMRKLGFNMLFLCVIAAVLYFTDLVSGKIILYIMLPLLFLFLLLVGLQTAKVYKQLAEEEKKKSSMK